MRTLIVDAPNTRLHVKSKSLFINEKRVPMHLVEMLVIAQNAELTTKTLLHLSANNVPVLMVSKQSHQFALTLPQQAKNSEKKRAQFRSLEHRLGFAKYFVNCKITTHIKHLLTLECYVEEALWQEKVDNAKTISELLGYEGSFSSLYFQHYFAALPKVLHKSKRSKRPPLDPVNAVLSYLYTIVYNIITAQIHQSGLDPSMGYLHEAFRSHYALSSDMLELFRAKINHVVAVWFLDKTLELEDFSKKGGVYLRYESRKKLWGDIKELTDDIALATGKEIALLKAAI